MPRDSASGGYANGYQVDVTEFSSVDVYTYYLPAMAFEENHHQDTEDRLKLFSIVKMVKFRDKNPGIFDSFITFVRSVSIANV